MTYSTHINGKEYIEADIIEKNGSKYVYLVNTQDSYDFMIRKLITRDGKDFYCGLDDEKEFDLALMYFTKNHSKFFNEEDE